MINGLIGLLIGVIIGGLAMFFVLKDGYKQVGGK